MATRIFTAQMMNGAGVPGKRGFKPQAPTSKLQRNSKRQISVRPFEVLNLKFLWSLELGIWNFKTHNGGVSKTVGIIFCALIFLAGCATPPPEEPVPLVWSSTGTAPKPFTAQKLQPIVSRPRT